MTATADDNYATCPNCKWAGKLRKDGTMRKHRVAVDAGRIGSTGSLPQAPHGDICKGSGEKPWDHTPPEGGYKVETTKHGGTRLASTEALPTLEDVELPSDEADREQARQEATQDPEPSLDDYAKASRIIQSLIPRGRR